ncbi:MAG: hypothetical protein ACFCVA_12980 [Gammaproteobacteria bacterium]
MEQTRQYRRHHRARLAQFFLVLSVVSVLAYAGMYLVAMSPLLIRLLGPILVGA